MKQTAVEWLVEEYLDLSDEYDTLSLEEIVKQAKEMEEKNLLEMLHKFAFDYTYNYKGEKTIYEWIPEWFEEYKRLEQLNK
jgi:hypothetical protein